VYNGGMNLEKTKKLNIPKSPGIYQFKDKKGKIVYIGKAANLRLRVLSYWRESANHSPAKYSMLKKIEKIDWEVTESEIEALLLEANLIKKYQPQYNVALRDDKRFVYIKVSTDDEIPGVFITRKIEKSGKYFGPFTSVEAVRETLKAIRKIWSFCAERKEKKKPCFYYQINRCLGICAGLLGRKEYMEKVVKPIILFLEGNKNKVIMNYELRIKKYNANLQINPPTPPLSRGHVAVNMRRDIEEGIEALKYQLLNMKKVLAHANILSVGEKYANDVVELAKVLGLPGAPGRIEGYDISNIFGREAVGAMVVFSGGEPHKSEYRKFKIKIGEGQANDVAMLKEILTRRFKKVPLIRGIERVNEDGRKNNPPTPLYQGGEFWPLPDLIIIDGGKGQLNAAVKVLRSIKLDIPVIAISKGGGLRSAMARDKIFFPGEKKPLELPLASPALHLLKRVRDEAHRFALSYHKKLRKKLYNF
jgi:excinuclease ABC subunit C